jgi:hypothetical protein
MKRKTSLWRTIAAVARGARIIAEHDDRPSRDETYSEDTVAIEIDFGAPVNISRAHQRRLFSLVDAICDGYEARHPDRTMWAAGFGGKIVSMPITREDEEAGVPLDFDMSILHIECCERENYDHPAHQVDADSGAAH